MPKSRRSIVRLLLLGLPAAVLFTLIAMVALAAALVWLHLSDSALTWLNQLVKLAAVVLGVCIAVPRGGDRGLATGVLLALAYSALGYGMYVALGGGSFAAGNMLGEMLLGSAAGAVTGAVRANMNQKRSRLIRKHI